MRIEGLQKLTLLDYPGRLACTVFLAGCNLRCPFCHNAALVLPAEITAGEEIPRQELLSFLAKRREVLEGVCITGGEPLLSDDVFSLFADIKALGYQIKLDTNGSFPARLKRAVRESLVDFVAMDIKNSPNSYAKTVGLATFDLAPVRESAAFLLSGAVEYEFRTTVVDELHTLRDFEDIAIWLAGAKAYFLQAFVDSGALLQTGLHPASEAQMQAYATALRRTIPQVTIRGM
ncbi:MAG: anaerobic ribonucleoside-triphosphate reductase activating protein [Pygmaiobacter sp.]|nr:anaerobic ribonucleoside-triphosphate reductase activating protein [Pygmaiobacter sp.]